MAGEPGIGKTRLLAEFVAAARAGGLTVLTGRAAQYERMMPFDIFNNALGELMAQGTTLSPDLTPGDWALLRTALPSLERAEVPPTGATDRRHLYRAVHILLAALAAAHHLVVVFDDVHRLDPESADLLGYLLEHPADRQLTVVLAYRPSQLSPRVAAALQARSGTWAAARLELGPLTRAEVDGLLSPELTRVQRDIIYSESEGNPFYLQARMDRTASRRPEHPTAGALEASAELPWAIRMSLQAELDTVGEIPRLVAQAAAVTGDEVLPALTAAVAGLPLATVLEGMDTLKERDILRAGGPGARFSFRHSVLRQTIYEASGAGWLLGAHLRAAQELERTGMSVTERARHVERYAQPGDDDAVDLLVSAADAVHGHAPATAARWLEIALALIPDGQRERRLLILERLAQMLGISGEYHYSLDKLSEILALLPRGTASRTAAARMYAVLARRLGRTANARLVLQRELDAIDPDNPDAAALLLELAHVCFTESWDGGGLRHAEAAHALSRRYDRPAQTAYAAATIALAHIIAGNIKDAGARLDEASGIVGRLPDDALAGQLELFVSLCWACTLTERFQTGVVHLYRGLALARSNGQDYLLPPLLVLLTYASVVLGNVPEARRYADEAAAAAVVSGTPAYALIARTTQSFRPGGTGATTAVAAFEAALEQGDEAPDLLAGQALFDLSCALIGAGRTDAADHGKEDIERLVRLGGGETLPRITLARRARGHEALVRARLRLNDLVLARRHARYAADLAAWLPLDGSRGYAALALAQVMADDEPDAAARNARAAVGHFERIGAVSEAARSRQLAAEILDGTSGRLDGTSGRLDGTNGRLDGTSGKQDGANGRLDGASGRLDEARVGADGHGAGLSGGEPSDAAGLSPLALLSPRQRQVAELVAEAHSNRQIARALGIVERTVEAHVTQILRKLKLPSRAAIASAVTKSAVQSRNTSNLRFSPIDNGPTRG